MISAREPVLLREGRASKKNRTASERPAESIVYEAGGQALKTFRASTLLAQGQATTNGRSPLCTPDPS